MPVKNTPDLEQRRYEIAKDLLCASVASGGSCTKEDIQFAISTADDFIAELKATSELNRQKNHVQCEK